jgi:hypothetical protein
VHQVLIQTEPDDNIKDSALKLALKHPAQTTIVQMQKDGTYRVVTWESAWLIDNHGWADLRVSNALTLTPNSVDKNFTILLYSSILIALFFVPSPNPNRTR